MSGPVLSRLSRGGSALGRTTRRLSLDIVVGGVAGATFATHVSGARVPVGLYAVLGGAIWVVYTLDHLVDAHRAGPHAANDRHRFHWRHRTPLSLAAVVAGVATTAAAALALPRTVLLAGPLVGGLVLLHLWAVQARFPAHLPKEVSVAAIYTAGVWVGPLLNAPTPDGWTVLALALHFVVAAACVLLYSWYEVEIDAADDSPSLARSWGEPRLRAVLERVLIAAGGLAMIAALVADPSRRGAFIALAVLPGVLWLVLRWDRHLRYGERYRHAEWAFLLLAIPGLLAQVAD